MKGGDIQHDVVVGWVTIDSIEGGGFFMRENTKKLLISIINLLRALIELIIELIR
ncbi:hypothetical protein WL455_10090 [Staphylococcus epidermidis]|nr:hypothetical protein HMPREF0794_1761 [Staphylococcus epidermidis M23864:W2(grey)]MCM3408161.1 hypothetical protein [Staphylococcus epidermidis]